MAHVLFYLVAQRFVGFVLSPSAPQVVDGEDVFLHKLIELIHIQVR